METKATLALLLLFMSPQGPRSLVWSGLVCCGPTSVQTAAEEEVDFTELKRRRSEVDLQTEQRVTQHRDQREVQPLAGSHQSEGLVGSFPVAGHQPDATDWKLDQNSWKESHLKH